MVNKKKSNNNKSYGLGKERSWKKYLESSASSPTVLRSRGSFGAFDIVCFDKDICSLYSVKSTRSRYWSPASEIDKLKKVTVPSYCRKFLVIWWSPRKDRDKKGWEVIHID